MTDWDKNAWDADPTQDSTVYEFKLGLPNKPLYQTPLPKGHWFFHGAECVKWLPGAGALSDTLISAATLASGKRLRAVSDYWIMTVDRPLDLEQHKDAPAGYIAFGDHVEGTSHDDWTLMVALNDLPDDAGGRFRLVKERGGEIVGRPYPHKRGRGLMFHSKHWHGSELLTKKADRVSFSIIVQPK